MAENMLPTRNTELSADMRPRGRGVAPELSDEPRERSDELGHSRGEQHGRSAERAHLTLIGASCVTKSTQHDIPSGMSAALSACSPSQVGPRWATLYWGTAAARQYRQRTGRDGCRSRPSW